MMKPKKEGKTVWKGDHFDRLSEEILFLILSLILDLRSLCQCLLVCKRFARIVVCMETVSVTVPGVRCSALVEADEQIIELVRQGPSATPGFVASVKEKLISFLELCLSSFEPPRFLTSLQKFTKLKSINVSLTIPNNSLFPQQYLKWKVRIKTSGSLWTVRIVSLRFALTPEAIDTDFNDRLSRILPVFFCKDLSVLLWWVLNHVETLKTVVATTSENHCKLVLGDDLLTEHRKNPLGFRTPKFTRTAAVSQVTLPKSGYVLHGVDLQIIDFPPESGTVNDNDDPRTWDYDDDEKLLGEAVRTLLT